MITALIEETSSFKRYTICPQCKYEVHSPFHDNHHRIWQNQQEAKNNNDEPMKTKESIVVEAYYKGIKYKGVLYPDNSDEAVQ